jgi:hypothetical protein
MHLRGVETKARCPDVEMSDLFRLKHNLRTTSSFLGADSKSRGDVPRNLNYLGT